MKVPEKVSLQRGETDAFSPGAEKDNAIDYKRAQNSILGLEINTRIEHGNSNFCPFATNY